MKVQDIMSSNPVSVAVTATVRDVVDELLNADIRHVPVVDDGKLIGMISDRDIRSFVEPLDIQATDYKTAIERLDSSVGAIVETDVSSVRASAEVNKVIDIMVEQKLGAVPVTSDEDGTLVGIVSYIDVLRVTRETP